jgi:hypothetical protein
MDCSVCNGPLYLSTEMSAVVDWLDENTDVEKERITDDERIKSAPGVGVDMGIYIKERMTAKTTASTSGTTG